MTRVFAWHDSLTQVIWLHYILWVSHMIARHLMWCNTLHHHEMCCNTAHSILIVNESHDYGCAATHCNTLQHTASHCNTIKMCCNTAHSIHIVDESHNHELHVNDTLLHNSHTHCKWIRWLPYLRVREILYSCIGVCRWHVVVAITGFIHRINNYASHYEWLRVRDTLYSCVGVCRWHVVVATTWLIHWINNYASHYEWLRVNDTLLHVNKSQSFIMWVTIIYILNKSDDCHDCVGTTHSYTRISHSYS